MEELKTLRTELDRCNDAWMESDDGGIGNCMKTLDAALSKLEEQMRWVPCSERLPVEEGADTGDYVQIWTKWGGLDIAKKEWSQGWTPNHWELKGGGRLEMTDVTHWRQLEKGPTPPTE